MNDDQVHAPRAPADPPLAYFRTAPTGVFAWLPWFAAAGFALLAGFMLPAYFALRSEAVVLREQAALAEIQEKTLRQQIEAEHILSARRMMDLRRELQGQHGLGRLQVIPLVSPTDVASPSLAVAVWNPDSPEGELVVAALPALALDKSYQLWLFDPQHPAGTSLAVFAVDSTSDQVRVPFKLDRPGVTGASFKVSLENKGGASAAPEGPVVLVSH